MTNKDVQTDGYLAVGDNVVVITDSGFNHGVHKNKTISRIIISEFSDEEAMRLRVPMRERTLVFTDNSTASCYDRVIKR